MISIIIPVYNGEEYIERCIESISQQTYGDIEIIMVDDGSTDHSLAVAEKLVERHHNLTVIHQKNAGVSEARNKGLSHAKGQYITFVDIDDWLKPNALEHLLLVAKREQSQLTICGFEECREPVVSCEQEGKVTTYEKQAYISDYLLKGNTRCWSILFTKEVIGDTRFRKGLSIGEDMLFLVDLLPKIEKVSVLDEKGYCYFINEKGAMFSGFKKSYMDQITCWEIARECIVSKYPEHANRISSILMISTMLVAGKIAVLSREQRKNCKAYIEILKNTMRKEYENKQAVLLLDRGYRIKVKLFQISEELYFSLYHSWNKNRK